MARGTARLALGAVVADATAGARRARRASRRVGRTRSRSRSPTCAETTRLSSASDGKKRLLGARRGRLIAAILCASILLVAASSIGRPSLASPSISMCSPRRRPASPISKTRRRRSRPRQQSFQHHEHRAGARGPALLRDGVPEGQQRPTRLSQRADRRARARPAKLNAAFQVVPIAVDATQAGASRPAIF